MTIPKKIIELAIEGEWKPWWLGRPVKVSHSFIEVLEKEAIVYQWWQEIALDSSFWQALGKKLGWTGRVDMKFVNAFGNSTSIEQMQRWEMKYHQFSHILLTNGDTEKFWDDLLKDNK